MINEFINVKGNLNVVLIGPDGQVKEDRNIHNLVVTTGKNWIASRMKDGGPTQMTHMGVGSGTVDPAISDTTLGTPLTGGSFSNARVALTTAGGIVANNTVTYDATFSAGVGTGAITEAGIFTASTAGTMLCRTEFLPVNKAADDTLTVQWIVTIS